MSSEGCIVGNKSSEKAVECFCNHLSTFASGFLVAPNTIDFAELEVDPTKNPVIFITLSIIAVLYTLLAVWARHADRKDLTRVGCIPMDSNDPLDKYLYEVRVTTGSRSGAGTKSKVCLVVSGEWDETCVRPLNGYGQEILKRGQTDSFLMAVPRPMGPLQYVRVWHDNSGPSEHGSWFLNYIIIVDLQTKIKYPFVANRWLAVEEEDGEIDKVFPVSGDSDLLNFSHLFTERTKKDLADDHLWISIFTRPVCSRFTRLQRVSCCLLLLMLSMITSAMFYEKDETSLTGLQWVLYSQCSAE
ncbi:hypothetical protein EB796_008702 [Bugula neritina]|uniref:PLAT domain-containing protein n=1 Tax=Bugula neritina TaxID=10212 RepID=A0A7J7K2Z3_BUGNE|nr:hypothetical protein EB796_008702 [Bugula neritina]